MKKIKDVTLAFSCTEKKGSFTKSERGFLCKKCSTEVVDFTQKSSAELEHAINNFEKPVCGIFKQKQLSERFLKYAAATLIVTSSVTLIAFGQEKVNPDSLVENNEPETTNNEIFLGLIVESGAEPIGGYAKFIEALSKEIKYPIALTTKGKCFVEFCIDTAGQMIDFKIIKSFNNAADQETLRALAKLNYPWKPARQRNKPVKSRMVIPIAFDPDKKTQN